MNRYVRIAIASTLAASSAMAAPVVWDGGATDGLWLSAGNWDGNTLPVAADTVVITNGDAVATDGVGILPSGCTITLGGGSTLNQYSGAIRLNGSSIHVTSDGGLSGDFWDLNNASIYFEDGASVNIAHWENKGSNYFSFELGPTGFTKLNAHTFWIGGGATISDATYHVDLAAYTGPMQDIVLVDYSQNNAGVTAESFQNATIILENTGGRAFRLEYDELNHDIVLKTSGTVISTPGLSITFDENAVPVSVTNAAGGELLSNTSSKGFFLVEADNSERRFDTIADLGGGNYRFGISGSSEQFDIRAGGTNDYMTMRFIDLNGFALDGERLYFEVNVQGERLQDLELDYMVAAHSRRDLFRVERWNLWETSNTNKLGAFALYEFTDTAQEDEALLDIWVNENLPHPALSGVWNRATAEAWLDDWVDMAYDTSYLNILPDTFAEHDDFLPYAVDMDASAIYLWNNIWRGEYWLQYRQNDEVNPDMYPNGLTDLQSYGNTLSANGMNLMIHYLSGNVGEEDPEFTSSTVHPDLQSWGTMMVTGTVSSSDTTIMVIPDAGVEMPIKSSSSRPQEAPPYIPSFFEFKTFRIGNEWISASSVTDLGGGVWQLDGVSRGKWNTAPASYADGQDLRGYLRPYNNDFVPDPNSELFDTIATRWANLNNTLGTTKSEFDGFENHLATGEWGSEKFGYAVYSNLDHPSTANTSSGRPPKAWLEYRFNRVKDALGGNFETRQHAILFLGDDSRITPGSEEIEHQMNKFMNLNNRGFSLGSYDVKGIALNTLQNYGQTDKLLELVRDWKDASFALSPTERDAMDNFRPYDSRRVSINGNHQWAESQWRLTGSDFRKWLALGTDIFTHEWHTGQEHGAITPRFYLKNGDVQTLEVPADLSSGADQTRIVGRVLPHLDEAAAGNIDLMTYLGTSALTLTESNTTGSDVWKDSDFTSYTIEPNPAKWIDLSNHRGLGCWVTGDGSGAVLVIRLKRNNNARDYAVPINFTGKRWVEIPTGEQAWRLKDWGWAVATRKNMDYRYVNYVEIGIGHIPANTSCSVLVEDLQALEESADALVDPSITLGEQTVNITGSIPVEHHFVLEANGDFTVYDENWSTVSFQSLETPLLPAGLGSFSISSATASSNVWIEVGVQASNESLHNPAFTANGTPWRWLDGYGLTSDLIDEDIDGHLTWQEYIAGTDPTNEASVFRLNIMSAGGGEAVFNWNAVSGKTYSVWTKTNLMDSVWMEELSDIPGDGSDYTHTSAVDGVTGFFRVGVEP